MSQISSSAPAIVARPSRISSFAPLAGGVPAALLLALALGARHETYDPAAPSSSLFSLSRSISPDAPNDSVSPDAPPVSVARPSKNQLQAMAARGEWPRVQTALAVAGVSWSAPLAMLPPVRGRAPMAGQVSRVSVRVGQSVAVNDTILQLSGGPSSRVARAGSRVERRQSAAEQQQVAAANRQAQLQQKMVAAQAQLAAAQERVAAAQQRVDQARGIVARLRRGETVQAPARAAKPQRTARRVAAPNPKRDAALKAARELESQARAAQAEAAKAKHQFEILGARAGAAHNAVQTAQSAVATAQKRFDAKETKAADLDAARAAQEEAVANEKSVASDLASARSAVSSSQARADAAESKAKSAAKEAGSMPSLRDMMVFGDDNAAPETSDSSAQTPAGAMSVTDAARLARSALNESEAAVAEARRIKERVDLYAGQVSKTRSDISASSRNLESAQNAVLDQTIETNLASVRAPAAGVVESIASVAQAVSEGDTVVTIGRAGRLRARWTDATNAWRALKPDQTVPVEIAAPDGSARGTIARISEITAMPNGGASIEAFIHNPRVGAGRAWQSGWQARALLDAKAGSATTRVPQDALVGAGFDAGALMRVAVLAPVAGESAVQLQWRRVRLQKRATTGDAANQWTISGVRVGERVALNAQALPPQSTKLRLVG